MNIPVGLACGQVRLGLDIDGTVTSDPGAFARLARTVIAGSGEVHVVSSRSVRARAQTIAELDEYCLPFTSLHLLPEISAAQTLCPHSGLDWFRKHQWLKVDYALERCLSHFVDDDPKVLDLFFRFAPAIVVCVRLCEFSSLAVF